MIGVSSGYWGHCPESVIQKAKVKPVCGIPQFHSHSVWSEWWLQSGGKVLMNGWVCIREWKSNRVMNAERKDSKDNETRVICAKPQCECCVLNFLSQFLVAASVFATVVYWNASHTNAASVSSQFPTMTSRLYVYTVICSSCFEYTVHMHRASFCSPTCSTFCRRTYHTLCVVVKRGGCIT